MQPNATVRFGPLYSRGMRPKTEGIMKLAPKPTSTRPIQMNTNMLGATASTTSPAAHRSAPARNVRFQPKMVPMRPPATMKAPPTSG